VKSRIPDDIGSELLASLTSGQMRPIADCPSPGCFADQDRKRPYGPANSAVQFNARAPALLAPIHQPHTHRGYPSRSATMGSTRAARLAGPKQAASAITDNTTRHNPESSHVARLDVEQNTFQHPANAYAPAIPMPIPTNDTIMPCPATRNKMLPGRAPKAIRKPISRVRWLTAYDNTP